MKILRISVICIVQKYTITWKIIDKLCAPAFAERLSYVKSNSEIIALLCYELQHYIFVCHKVKRCGEDRCKVNSPSNNGIFHHACSIGYPPPCNNIFLSVTNLAEGKNGENGLDTSCVAGVV